MSDRPIDLILINDDPVFQLGLQAALAGYPDVSAIAAVKPAAALERLAQLPSPSPQVALVEWTFVSSPADQQQRLQWCRELKAQSPPLGILLLSSPLESQLLDRARTIGIDGYCPKGTGIDELVEALRQVAAGRSYWPDLPVVRSGPVRRWLVGNCQDGLRQIDNSLASLSVSLDDPQLPLLDWLLQTGRRRELRTARWLVERLASDRPVISPTPISLETPAEEELTSPDRNSQLPEPLAPSPPSALTATPSLLQRTLEQIRPGVKNTSGISLPFDILRPDKRQELLYLVLHQLEEVLEELRYLQIPLEELPQRRSQILREIWQAATLNFYSKYYTLDGRAEPIVDLLMQEIAQMEKMTLDRIPFVVELFAYLLHEVPLVIDNVPYRHSSPEAEARATIFLDNLTVQLANAVMQLLLNRFAEIEPGKYRLYDPRYLSSRDIAKLRNNLSWQYRQDYYVETPKAIFESRHRLFVFVGTTLQTTSISAPRRAELQQLRGIPWLMTMALETRDAIAPRLRAIVAFLGEGAVYLLTQVVGKAIGLIGRGMIQGFGNALQETRYGKNSQRGK